MDRVTLSDRGHASARPPAGLRRLCVFLADLHGGGAERVMVRLAAGIAARGVSLDLVLARAVGPYLDEVPETVRVVDLDARRVALAVRPFVAYLRRKRPDMVFTTLPHASLAAAIARSWAAVPTLLVLREATTPSRRRVATLDIKTRAVHLAMRAAYAAADGVVAVSEGVADDLRRTWGVPDRKLWTLYSPLVTPDVAEKAAAEPDHPWMSDAAVPVVLGVGALQPYKGFCTLLEAFARVRASRAVRLVVLGEGPQRPELEAHARALGIADHVAFPGFRVNPFAYMARSAVFVLASEREGLPGALVQAMACGCPVVATDCPSGPAEVLEDGRYGTLVGMGDADAMADGVIHALDEPADSDALRSRAARFASDRVIDDHLETFGRAVRAAATTPEEGTP